MSEAAPQCFGIFSQNYLVNICGSVLTFVKYLTGLLKIYSIIANIKQLIDTLRQFMCLYFLYQNRLSTISSNSQNF